MWYIIQTDTVDKNIQKIEKLLGNTAKAVFFAYEGYRKEN